MNIQHKERIEMEEQKKFMREAIKISIENVKSGNGGPFGSVVVKEGEIIGRGVNKVADTNDPTAHAEIMAIREACKKIDSFQLTGCDIYCSCEPCPMCLGAIYWARPSRLYYANTKMDAAEIKFDDEYIYSEIGLPKENRKLPTIQLLRDEAIVAFNQWKDSNKVIKY